MFLKFKALAAVVLVLSATPALAQVEVPANEMPAGDTPSDDTAPGDRLQKSPDFDYDACLQAETAGQTGWGNCSQRQLALEEAAMAAAYNELVGYATEHSPSAIPDFAMMQSNWVIYRDAYCDIEYQLDGAMQGALDRGECLVEMTAGQTRELKGLKDRLEHPEDYR